MKTRSTPPSKPERTNPEPASSPGAASTSATASSRVPLDLDLLVILADPRLPFPDHPSGAQDDHDRRDVERLEKALTSLVGRDRIRYLDDHDRLLEEVQSHDPDLVLNFCNAGFRNRPELQLHVPALLEMLDLPFAGTHAACMALCHDKSAVHAAAASAGIAVPRQELLHLRREEPQLPRSYPALLKPNDGSGSAGITTRSLVQDADEAHETLSELARAPRPPVWMVAEEFLPGRELSVAVLGPTRNGDAPSCLAVLEVDYDSLPADLPRIMTHDSKTDEGSVYWQKLVLRRAELPEDVRQGIERDCLRMFDRLDCRDYARLDFRLDAEDVPRLIDANAHPEWGSESMMAHMAGFAGLDYADFLARIIESALYRLDRGSSSSRPRRSIPRTLPGARNGRTTGGRRASRRRETTDLVLHGYGLRLRDTRLEDIPFVRDAESAAENRDFIEQWSANRHAACLEDPDCAHLIIEDDREDPAGYVILQGLTDPDRAILLRRIVVTRKGEGLGSRALEAIERHCFESLGCLRLWLEVHDDNDGARELYAHHGFEVEDVQPGEEGEPGTVRMARTAAARRSEPPPPAAP